MRMAVGQTSSRLSRASKVKGVVDPDHSQEHPLTARGLHNLCCNRSHPRRHPAKRLPKQLLEHLVIRPVVLTQPIGHPRIDFLLIETAVTDLTRLDVEASSPMKSNTRSHTAPCLRTNSRCRSQTPDYAYTLLTATQTAMHNNPAKHNQASASHLSQRDARLCREGVVANLLLHGLLKTPRLHIPRLFVLIVRKCPRHRIAQQHDDARARQHLLHRRMRLASGNTKATPRAHARRRKTRRRNGNRERYQATLRSGCSEK